MDEDWTVRFFIEKCTGKVKILKIFDIAEDITYDFPAELQDSALHTELSKHPTYLTSVKGIKSATGKRSFKVTLAAHGESDLSAEYTDEFGNFVFREELLIEGEPIPTLRAKKTEPLGQSVSEIGALQLANQALMEKLKLLEGKLEGKATDDRLGELEGQLTVEKFWGDSQNGAAWWLDFEAEMARLNVASDAIKIKILKDWTKGTAQDWFRGVWPKLGIDEGKFADYKQSFATVFEVSGWSTVRHAFGYRYQSGSPKAYALKKALLLRQDTPDIADKTLVKLIVFGLPVNLQEKIDADRVTDPDRLMRELARFDGYFPSTQHAKPDGKVDPKQTQQPKRTRCRRCRKFHAGECTQKSGSRVYNVEQQAVESEDESDVINLNAALFESDSDQQKNA